MIKKTINHKDGLNYSLIVLDYYGYWNSLFGLWVCFGWGGI